MSLLILAAAAALAAPPAPALAQASAVRAPATSAQRADDRRIELAVIELYRTDPERNVCVERTLTGSRQPRAICGTVARWFAARLPSEVAAGDPPYQLVEEIKRQRRKAQGRARGG